MRDHGGDIGAAARRFGGAPEAWLDLSTGINRVPWPMPALPAAVLRDLPTAAATGACAAAAGAAYGAAGAACLPVAGAQAAIGLVARLRPPGRVGVVAPTYNEHAAAFAAAGWQVVEVPDIAALAGFDAAVIVNPNNPDGRRWPTDAVLALGARNGFVVVDESFADAEPETSICPHLTGAPGFVVLRSFGKFYGLAGLRLGFALGAATEIARLAALAGPWAVNGPALHAGRLALGDAAWTAATRTRLAADADRLDGLAGGAGWRLVGGTRLFRLYDTGDAEAAQAQLGRRQIWSRAFPYSSTWLRLGLPGTEAEWSRLAAALCPASSRRSR
ncbi:MAG: threonine-phosphate decarboxylase CobD [Amaricoccus sp.]|uniref:threonine-phosphate decarboxylase CobD n=1 Tax=Amaricoccus sp. TaxID=1872485 RepID=UPI0039E48A5B